MCNNDIKMNNSNINFKFRVNGILIKDNKILTVKIHKNDFYCLPGGHVKLGEDTQKAIIREFKEETEYEVKIDKLLCIIENFFDRKNGEKVHEIGFYYLLNIKNEQDIKFEEFQTEEDDIKMKFKWISINELENVDFRPQELKNKLENKDNSFQHFILNNK